jgi:peptidase E
VELHLFSAGDPDSELRWAAEVGRERLEGKNDATIACLPFGSLYVDTWMGSVQRAFKKIAEPRLINSEMMDLREMEGVLRGAALAYLPDGNAFLFNHRLHLARLLPYLRQKIRSGLPLLAVGAGAVMCGPNILTTDDLNLVPTPHFESLGISPFNFHVRYEDDPRRDSWLAEYHIFHDNPVILLEGGAYVKITNKMTTLVRGTAWCWRTAKAKERLLVGGSISLNRGE